MIVSNCGFECLICQARVVDHRDGHEGSEAGYLLELDPWLTDDFLDVDVFEGADDIINLGLDLTVLSLFTCGFLLLLVAAGQAWVFEDVVGDTLVWLEDSVDNVFVC